MALLLQERFAFSGEPGQETMTIYKIELECTLETEPWLVDMSDDEDPIFSFKPDPRRSFDGVELEAKTREVVDYLMAPAARFNAWQIRERFFAIDKPNDALKFFREFGVWRFSRSQEDKPSYRFPISWSVNDCGEPFSVSFSDLIYLRNYFEDALNGKPSEWIQRANISTGNQDRDVEIIWEVMYLYSSSGSGFDISVINSQGTAFPGPFKGEVRCVEIQDALRASVLLDWMEGREWPRCQECRRVFKRTSKRPQFYCSAKCSSRVRQSNFRKNLRQQTERER